MTLPKMYSQTFTNRCRFIIHHCLAATLMVVSGAVDAHTTPNTAMFVDIGADDVSIELQLPIDELRLANDELPLQPGQLETGWNAAQRTQLRQYILQHIQLFQGENEPFTAKLNGMGFREVDDQRYLWVKLLYLPANGSDVGKFRLHYDVILHRVVSHKIYVSLRSDFGNGIFLGEPELLEILRYQHEDLSFNRQLGSNWIGFTGMVKAGMQHIVEGMDHWLFLICLLLPIPLVSRRGHAKPGCISMPWFSPLLKVVTAFTLGHAATLALATFHLISVPARPVEILVAVSILFAAMQIAWPALRKGAVLLACSFGLVHGLAFSENMTQLGFGFNETLFALAGFNLGIESSQLMIVALVMPWLLLVARTSSYFVIAWPVAILCSVIASGWILERSLGSENALQPIIDVASNHLLSIYVIFVLLCLTVLVAKKIPLSVFRLTTTGLKVSK